MADKEENKSKNELEEMVKETVEKVRNESMIYGARIICSNVMQILDNHLHKASKVSMNDYKRCFKELYEFVSVPLKKTEEKADDGVPAESDKQDS